MASVCMHYPHTVRSGVRPVFPQSYPNFPYSKLFFPISSLIFHNPHLSPGSSARKRRAIICSSKSDSEQESLICFSEQCRNKRREALIQILFSALSLPFASKAALADTDAEVYYRLYTDETNKFKIMVPQDWLVGKGEANGIRSVTAFYPEKAAGSNVSVLITGLGPDYTRLESFGNVDAFAETLVSGLDRSWQRPPGVAAKLIDSKAANGLYYIEYSLKNPGESTRHIFSVMGIGFNGWNNRLYTVTGQFLEEEREYRPTIEKSISSFRLI